MRDSELWYSVSQKGGRVLEIFPRRSDAERYVSTSKSGFPYEIKAMWMTSGGSGRILKEAVMCTDEAIEAKGMAEENKTFFNAVVSRAAKSVESGSDIVAAIKEAIKDEVEHQAGMMQRPFRPLTGREGELLF